MTGNDVILSLNAGAQRIAMRALQASGHRGAVVALEPSTGRILVMASYPTYDPNLVDTDFQSVLDQAGAPLLNRATQGLYPPGSTFKIVTAAAALDHGQFTPDSEFKGGQCVKTQGPQLCNASGEVAPDPNTLADALVHSYNTTFAQIGQKLGQDAPGRADAGVRLLLADPDRLPARADGDQRHLPAAGPDRRPGPQGRRRARRDRPGRPARDAAADGDGHGDDRERRRDDGAAHRRPHPSPSGRVVSAPRHERSARPISAQTASTLSGIMQRVVDEGTGQAAQIGDLQVAGKTGTAQTGRKDYGGPAAVRRLVRRVRAGVVAEGRDRGRDRGLHGLRRNGRRTRRPRHPE